MSELIHQSLGFFSISWLSLSILYSISNKKLEKLHIENIPTGKPKELKDYRGKLVFIGVFEILIPFLLCLFLFALGLHLFFSNIGAYTISFVDIDYHFSGFGLLLLGYLTILWLWFNNILKYFEIRKLAK